MTPEGNDHEEDDSFFNPFLSRVSIQEFYDTQGNRRSTYQNYNLNFTSVEISQEEEESRLEHLQADISNAESDLRQQMIHQLTFT